MHAVVLTLLLALDAGVSEGPVRSVEFDSDEGLGGDEITARDPKDVEFEPLPLPDRYHTQDEAAAPRRAPLSPPPEPSKRGCAGCEVAGALLVTVLRSCVRRR
jgi:hypothetical protein